MEQAKFKISEENVNTRLDKFLKDYLGELSRVYIQELIEEGYILVNDKKVKSSYKTILNDEIVVNLKEVEELNVEAQDIPLDIVYEDKDVIVINKPQGMVVHPASGVYKDTLVNALLYHCKDLSSINGVKRPGIVHRLDKDTSGLIMVAKNDNAHNFLAEQLKDKTASRVYVALVHGKVKVKKGIINAPIGRDPKSRVKMAVVKDGKEAITEFSVLKYYHDFTLIECHLKTGRTHQIRVHMSYIGYPLVGDPLYGPRKLKYGDKQYLHAKELSFIHPTTKERVTFKTDLPEYFQNFLNKIESNN